VHSALSLHVALPFLELPKSMSPPYATMGLRWLNSAPALHPLHFSIHWISALADLLLMTGYGVFTVGARPKVSLRTCVLNTGIFSWRIVSTQAKAYPLPMATAFTLPAVIIDSTWAGNPYNITVWKAYLC